MRGHSQGRTTRHRVHEQPQSLLGHQKQVEESTPIVARLVSVQHYTTPHTHTPQLRNTHPLTHKPLAAHHRLLRETHQRSSQRHIRSIEKRAGHHTGPRQRQLRQKSTQLLFLLSKKYLPTYKQQHSSSFKDPPFHAKNGAPRPSRVHVAQSIVQHWLAPRLQKGH